MSKLRKVSSKAKKIRIIDFLLPGACVLLFCGSQYQHLQNDLWVDELYTLEHFSLKPVFFAATHYQVHIPFSILQHVWLTIFRLNSLQDAISHPMLLRCLPLLLSALTVVYVYKAGRLIQGKWPGLLSAIVLITTIPFYNFAVQLRGYSLSMMLTAALAYQCLRLIITGKKNQAVIALLSALLLYSLPSDLYLLIAGIIVAFAGFFISRHSSSGPNDRWLKLAIAMIAGAAGGALCYLPVLRSMLADSHLKSSPGINTIFLVHTVPVIFYHLLSARWAVLLICLAGVISAGYSDKMLIQILAAFAGLLLLPFMLCALRNDEAPYRVFIIIVPVLAVIVGVCCAQLLSATAKYFLPFAILLCCYCLTVFCLQAKKINDVLYEALLTGKYWQDLYFQYYQSGYQPREDIAFFHRQHPIAKLVLMHDAEPYELSVYSAPYSILWTRPEDFISEISRLDTALVVTRYPSLLARDLDQKTGQHWTVKQLRPEISYHNFMLVIRDKNAP